ncbi:olfactory receptor 1J1 [Pelodiscus sinensis]|uniref:olfactory receptor 1J1 n=1 Tax=Pelodiscus sinensis TaxID=13735 RepID=UPI003F6B236F
MDEANWTSISEFVFSGVSDRQDLQPLIFAGLLATYLVNIVGNFMLLVLMWTNPQLRTPMYFLLSQLAIVDMGTVSVILPEALVHVLNKHRAISFTNCMVQLFIWLSMGNMGSYLLAAMAYDRYVAVCNPLRYATVVTQSLCLKMVAGSWVVVLLHALLDTVMVARLRYCGNHLQLFFCDLPPLLLLSCTRPITIELVIYTEGVLVMMTPFAFIVSSYIRIGLAVARLRSAEGLRKALVTCSSHLTVVILFYSTATSPYVYSDSSDTKENERVAAVFYTAVAPALNPLIYSLRNKDVAAALRRTGRKILAWGK